ncbi:hypothetical protein [Sphingomonas sanguinis]|uniref:hypothetical protein n=1 Tax=Sphingomonas sanguinis TaxID=33051 RepID=UPI00128EB96A|nr:hypothetical protein [Sphingomonas sanguinis]
MAAEENDGRRRAVNAGVTHRFDELSGRAGITLHLGSSTEALRIVYSERSPGMSLDQRAKLSIDVLLLQLRHLAAKQHGARRPLPKIRHPVVLLSRGPARAAGPVGVSAR